MSVERTIQRESDRTRLTKLVRDLLAGGLIPAGARDLTLVRAAASLASVGLRRDVADQAMRDLHSLLEQPRGDTYQLSTAMKKLDVAYRQPWAGAFRRNGEARSDHPNTQPVGVTEYERPGKATPEQLDAPFTATPIPFELPVSPAWDETRIRRLWERNIPAIPMPAGTKAGSDRARPPRWKHLQDGRPTESDWKLWSSSRFAQGNTAIVMGHDGGAICFGVIEFEHAEDFYSHPDHEWFLANTPVVASAKSIHTWIVQKLNRVAGDKPTRGDNDGDALKQRPVRYEFRGAGNVDTAPGSIHPSGVVYTQVNPECKTILEVENVPAFVYHYIPTLFAPAVTLESLDGVLVPTWEMDIAELWESAPEPKALHEPDLHGHSVMELTNTEAADLAEWEEAREPESRRKLSKARNDELYGFRRLATKALAMFPPSTDQTLDTQLDPLALIPSQNLGPNLALAAIPLLLPDPAWFPTPQAMEALLASVMPGGDQRIRDFRMCGWWTRGMCNEHGERLRTHRTCKATYDPRCPTKLTMKLRQLHLPDLDLRGENYRMLHLTRRLPYGKSASFAMAQAHTQFVELVARIAHRKEEHTGVEMMMRATAYQLGRDSFYVVHKIVLGELDAEKANATLTALALAMGAQVWGQRITPRGEAAILQMMDDSMYSFIGFLPDDELTGHEQRELFSSYLAAVRHRHMAEPMSSTRFYMKGMAWHDERPTCDLCGRKLYWLIEKPEWLQAQDRAHAPPMAA